MGEKPTKAVESRMVEMVMQEVNWTAICDAMADAGVWQFLRCNGWGNLEWQVNQLLKRLVRRGVIVPSPTLPLYKLARTLQ